MNENITTIICSALLSGALASIVNLIYFSCKDKKDKAERKAKEVRDYKIRVFSDMLGYRGQMVNDSGKELQVATNQIFLAFQDNPQILELFKNFCTSLNLPQGDTEESNNKRSDAVIDSLLYLLKAMCDDLNIKYDFMNDDLFKKPVLIGNDRLIVVNNSIIVGEEQKQ